MQPLFTEDVLFYDSTVCPAGSLDMIVRVKNVPALMPQGQMHIYGKYLTVYVTRGRGRYADSNGFETPVKAGDIMFIVPDLPHFYSPDVGTDWDELYTVFNGPIFDTWRQLGMLDPTHPVRRGPTMEYWLSKLNELAALDCIGAPTAKTIQILKFLELLTEVLGATPGNSEQSERSLWSTRACAVLASDLGADVSIGDFAARMDMSADMFRRRFKRDVGCTPVEYRARRKIEIACQLLLTTTMTHVQIARQLGFGDEYFFSKRFHQIKGITPRDFRQQSRQQMR